MNILLETPVFTAEAALKAARCGVDRLELCSSFGEGGETPGPGMLKYLKKKIGIPVFVMIRPRGGDFFYSPEEIDVMAEEVRVFTSLGADGFVFGCLNSNGTVDEDACRMLLDTAEGKPCTFHRAFDVLKDQYQALGKIIRLGFSRVLTSGGKQNVTDGLNTIRQLLEISGDEIIIMPGGGLKPEHIGPLNETGKLREIHTSCKKMRDSSMTFHHPEVVINSNVEIGNRVVTFDAQQYARFKKSILSVL